MSERKTVTQHPRQLCYFCGSEGPIQTHHIVPQRYNGGDHNENLVDLCPTCHERLERLYNKSFYQALDIEKDDFVKDDQPIPEHHREKRGEGVFMIKNLIRDAVEKYNEACSSQVIHGLAKEKYDWSHETTEIYLRKASNKGEIYQPTKNNFRTT